MSHADAEKDAVVVPTTMEEYCMKAKPLRPAQDSIEMDDFYDDDCYCPCCSGRHYRIHTFQHWLGKTAGFLPSNCTPT